MNKTPEYSVQDYFTYFMGNPYFCPFKNMTKEQSALVEAINRFKQQRCNKMVEELLNKMEKQQKLPRRMDPNYEFDPTTRHWKKRIRMGKMEPEKHPDDTDQIQRNASDNLLNPSFKKFMHFLKQEEWRKKDKWDLYDVSNGDVEKQIEEPFAVATEQAKKMGYSDFSEGSPGRTKRDEIAEALKREQKSNDNASKFLNYMEENHNWSPYDPKNYT